MNTVISIDTLHKRYKDVSVLKGVNLEVRRGEIFALLGSNGAGKTTTVNILSTLAAPDAGAAFVCGYDVVKQGGKVRENISLTGQYAAVDEVLTGHENLCMIGKLRHIKDASGKASKLLKDFSLEDAGDRRVSTYSGGMRRRIDIAMSIIGDPAVIFLDEPTTGLDPQSRYATWHIIESLAQSGTTIFLTTQYLDEAEHLADRIAILNEGKIIANDTPGELKKVLPQGIIEFSFQSEQAMEQARELLKDLSIHVNSQALTITIITDGKIQQLTNLFNKLNDAQIAVAGFTQKSPTLEDAFLTLIGEKKEDEV